MATEEQTTVSVNILALGVDYIRAGQRLTITNRIVSKLSIYLKKLNSPTGNVTIAIRKVSDDSIIASKVWGDAGSVATTGTWLEVTFDTPVTINEEVRILAEYSAGSGANVLRLWGATDVKANELGTYYQPSGVWTDSAAWDSGYKYTYTSTFIPQVIFID